MRILCWLALGVACGRDAHDPLLRPVVHSFIRGVGGAVVTLSNPGSTARLWLAGEEADEELGEAWRRFPLLTCTTCGQHYYETWVKDFRLVAGKRAAPEGGDLVGATRVWEHLSQELGGVRALLVNRLVVQPDEDDDADSLDEDGNVEAEAAVLPSGHDYDHRRLHPLWVCGHCGALHEQAGTSCAACHVTGALTAVQVVRCKEDLPGVLHSCVACQAPGRRPGGGRYREPARPVRAVSVSDVHVLAQSMLHLSERPRLLVFADNRQDAAFQAGWMRDHARRFRLRALMSQAIPASGASIGDVAQRLDAVLEADRELSRALIPEVWQVAPQEDAGVKHREERLYFLRLQALREIATGVKQRLGLEPWGRVRVEYVGLDAEHEVIARWAKRLGFEPLALAEGVAALLDHVRRTRVLHDEPTRLFGKLWRDGDKEIQYGYLPAFSGGPRGAKLSRTPSDSPARVTQWIGTRPTQVWNAVSTWRIDENDLEDFLRELWGMLTSIKLLVPVTLEGWGKPLPGSAGTFQVDATKLRLLPHRGRWRCEKCRRTTVRRGPTSTCLAWRCAGKLAWEESDPDDFDLHVLDGNYAMLRVAEHSAQVPADVRERIENQFKGQSEHLNALVCTPTLELGVDIGALDAVLMRNVPPSAANYWQRAGRAGRRHRMAVDITYAQATGFDQSYFREPLKLLGGLVEPPRFNLKNEVMLRKHVHATVLTALHGLGRHSPEGLRARVEEVLARCFPFNAEIVPVYAGRRGPKGDPRCVGARAAHPGPASVRARRGVPHVHPRVASGGCSRGGARAPGIHRRSNVGLAHRGVAPVQEEAGLGARGACQARAGRGPEGSAGSRRPGPPTSLPAGDRATQGPGHAHALASAGRRRRLRHDGRTRPRGLLARLRPRGGQHHRHGRAPAHDLRSCRVRPAACAHDCAARVRAWQCHLRERLSLRSAPIPARAG